MSAAPIPIAPVTPARLAEIIADLPAADRAQWQWAPTELRTALLRLMTEPLTSELIEHVCVDVLRMYVKFAKLLLRMPAGGFGEEIGQWLCDNMTMVEVLSPPDRRKATRALLTMKWVVQVGFSHMGELSPADFVKAEEQLYAAAGQLSTNPGFAFVRANVWCIALLHSLETSTVTSRTSEIAKLADTESMVFAQQVSMESDPRFRMRLPWYFNDADQAAEYESIAAWAEPRLTANEQASQLVDAWAQDDVAEQTSSWQTVKKALDEDRLSGRNLFE